MTRAVKSSSRSTSTIRAAYDLGGPSVFVSVCFSLSVCVGSGQSRMSLFDKYQKYGGRLEEVNLELLTERLREMSLSELYEYMNYEQLTSRLGYSTDQAQAIQANCRRKGGVFVRWDPNAPCVRELQQYWVVTKT